MVLQGPFRLTGLLQDTATIQKGLQKIRIPLDGPVVVADRPQPQGSCFVVVVLRLFYLTPLFVFVAAVLQRLGQSVVNKTAVVVGLRMVRPESSGQQGLRVSRADSETLLDIASTRLMLTAWCGVKLFKHPLSLGLLS